jgi:serine/threonine protein kinase
MQLMRHERIVEFIDFEMDFFVMISEMMPLGSLYTRIKNKRINWPDRYQVMLDICEGMAHLHAKKNQDGTSKKEFLHHGLNSKCVRLCVQDGHLRAKVAEFGLDFVQEEGNFLVDREKRFYQAPELYEVAGKKVEFTKKCDMFSAGVVFLELTLLRLPDDLYLEVYPEILKRDLPSKTFNECLTHT